FRLVSLPRHLQSSSMAKPYFESDHFIGGGPMLEKVDTASITHHLAPIVAKDTLLISDGEKAYGAFAARQGILHVWIIASKGEHVWRGYHIQNVNAYAGGLETWMVRFRGAATKIPRQLPRLA